MKHGDMIKCVMIQLCKYLAGLSYLALYVLLQAVWLDGNIHYRGSAAARCRMACLGNDSCARLKYAL